AYSWGPAYYGYYPDYYDYPPPYAYAPADSYAPPPPAQAAPPTQACGNWSWDAQAQRYNWIPCS
ncbi:MAG: hypothetical protein ACXU8S_11515, partial [Phenylobacterium sp.]